ncbi:MAG: hypothetical protein AVDCRST_MAG51-1885, partial [uncultured Ramlibacter sp.]
DAAGACQGSSAPYPGCGKTGAASRATAGAYAYPHKAV